MSESPLARASTATIALVFSHLALRDRGAFAVAHRPLGCFASRLATISETRAASPAALGLTLHARNLDRVREKLRLPGDWVAAAGRRSRMTAADSEPQTYRRLPEAVFRLWPTAVALEIQSPSDVARLADSPSWVVSLRHLALALFEAHDLSALSELSRLESLRLIACRSEAHVGDHRLPGDHADGAAGMPGVTRFQCDGIRTQGDYDRVMNAFPNLTDIAVVDAHRRPGTVRRLDTLATATTATAATQSIDSKSLASVQVTPSPLRVPSQLVALSAWADAHDTEPLFDSGWPTRLESLDLWLGADLGDRRNDVEAWVLSETQQGATPRNARKMARVRAGLAAAFRPLPPLTSLERCAHLAVLEVRAANITLDPFPLLFELPALRDLRVCAAHMAPSGMYAGMYAGSFRADAVAAATDKAASSPRESRLESVAMLGKSVRDTCRFPPVAFPRLRRLVIRFARFDLTPLRLPKGVVADVAGIDVAEPGVSGSVS